FVGRNRFDYLIEVESEAAVRAVRPDFARLAALEVRGVIVTAASAPTGAAHAASGSTDALTPCAAPYDFVSRFFAPRSGVNEDPVTGSAHCCLGPFWAKRLDKQELVGYQASSRGGIVRIRLARNRVILGGQAVTVLRGELV